MNQYLLGTINLDVARQLSHDYVDFYLNIVSGHIPPTDSLAVMQIIV